MHVVVEEHRHAIASIVGRQLDIFLLTVTDDGRFHRPAGHRLLHQPRELAGASHVLAVELDDHVGLFQAGFVAGAVFADLFDDDPAGLVRRLDVADRDAYLSAAARQHGKGAAALLGRFGALSVSGRCRDKCQKGNADQTHKNAQKLQ